MGPRRLSPVQHLARIRESVDVVLAVPLDQLSAEVVDCPGWRVDSVANHFAINSRAYEKCVRLPTGGNVVEAFASAYGGESTSSGETAVDTCRERYDVLLEVLRGADPDAPCPFLKGDANVAAWLWHIAVETWLHRADVEHTLGITPELSPDAGIDALEWSHFWRVQVCEQYDEPPPAIRCQAIDSDEAVVVGSGPVAATVSGKGCDLALRLWNRQHGPLQGDGDAVQAWADLTFRAG